jgi:hypothetical protein
VSESSRGCGCAHLYHAIEAKVGHVKHDCAHLPTRAKETPSKFHLRSAMSMRATAHITTRGTCLHDGELAHVVNVAIVLVVAGDANESNGPTSQAVSAVVHEAALEHLVILARATVVSDQLVKVLASRCHQRVVVVDVKV